MLLMVVFSAFMLDRLLGEPQRYHPLIIWGSYANKVERYLNNRSCWRGVLAWSIVVSAPLFILYFLMWIAAFHNVLMLLVSITCLYLSIGWQSLREHGIAVNKALSADLDTAREAVAHIVSRDTAHMDKSEIIRATIESLLENGADAIFAPLFWFILFGPIGAVGYRLANTLDAMWGYRTPQFNAFGWFSANVDDVLNYVPARLTALSYALLGKTPLALRCWYNQAPFCASPNAGPVMCSGAGSLAIKLGGRTMYHGEWCEKPIIGDGEAVQSMDIKRTIQLVDFTVYLWALLLIGFGVYQLA